MKLPIDGLESGQKVVDVNLGINGYKGELLIRVHSNATNHARGYIKDPSLLEQIGHPDITIAGIATTSYGQDYLVILDGKKGALASTNQLFEEEWELNKYVENTREALEGEVTRI